MSQTVVLESPIKDGKVDLKVLVKILLDLSPGELETLEIMLTPDLEKKLLERTESARAGNTVSLEQAREELLS